MKSKSLIFLGFILILFIIFSRIKFTAQPLVNIEKPNFSLENSYIKHFSQGKLKFSVQARTIDIYNKKLILKSALLHYINGPEIQAEYMEVDLKNATLLAKNRVLVFYDRINYIGEEVNYLIKEKKFFGYNGGRLIMEPK